MTTYAPNYTGRLRAKYVAAGVEHTAQLRKFRGATTSQIGDLRHTLASCFTVWNALLPSDFAWLSCEYANEDSDLFTPTDLPDTVTGTLDPTTYTPFQKITPTIFSGRSTGSKARVSLYGIFWEYTNQADDPNTVPYNGIITTAEDSRVGSTIALLNGQAASGAGVNAIWYPRATVKPNDYWVRQVRKGIVT